ncbi:MAG: AarF/UbiB family protein [Nannocystaceae bacterium]
MGTRTIANMARRTAKLAKLGLAARRVGTAKDDAQRERARRALAALMADARGIPMKFGQMLAANNESAFGRLTHSVAALPVADITAELARAWDRPISEVLAEIDDEGIAASLGQVHRAVLHDGTEIAIKVRYPHIADAVTAELKLAGLVPGVGPAKRWGFDLDAYRHMLAKNMARELDYQSEADRQARYGEHTEVPGLRVPSILPSLCRANVLVQTWERGDRLEATSEWTPTEKRQVALILIRTLFHSLFIGGQVHADPHPGNVYYSRRPTTVTLLDYGCTVDIAPQRRLALLSLILASRGGSEVPPAAYLTAFGFDAGKLAHVAERLPAVCRIMFKPFFRARAFANDRWRLGDDLRSILGDDRWWFRSAGPADSVLLVRAFQGLIRQLTHLGVALDWWSILQDTVGPDRLAAARSFRPSPTTKQLATPMPMAATHLKVRVSENGVQRVAIALPAESATQLRELIPPEISELVRRSNVDLDHVQARVLATALQPQPLLDVVDGSRRYRVWLE